MDTLDSATLPAAQAILSYVRAKPGQYTWYNIVRHIDRLGLLRGRLPYEILKALLALGYVEAVPNATDTNAKFNITASGLAYLAQLQEQPSQSTEPSALKLSDAELAVVLTALEESLDPFLAESDLLQLSEAELSAQLIAARNSLLERQLVFGSSDSAELGVEPHVRVTLKRIVQMQLACEWMQAAAGRPALRLRLVIDERGVLAYHLTSQANSQDTSRNPANEFWSLSSPHAAATWLAHKMALPNLSPRTGVSYAIPHAIVRALAIPNEMNAADWAARLQATGMPALDAEAFLAAGLKPVAQGSFSRLKLNASQVQSSVVLWFVGETSCWLVANLDAQGHTLVRQASAHDVEAALLDLMQTPATSAGPNV